ncbi:hypothetical protein P5V15_009634 [Pogonomyrmex californicus]
MRRLVSGGLHEKRLLNDLLDSYNSLERPVGNESEPLVLSFGLTLMQIIDVVSATIFFSFSIQYRIDFSSGVIIRVSEARRLYTHKSIFISCYLFGLYFLYLKKCAKICEHPSHK